MPMTREEFEAAFRRAESNYQKVMELMNTDSPFIEALPEKIQALSKKMRQMVAEIDRCKVGPEATQRVLLFKDLVRGFDALYTHTLTFFEETAPLWVHNKELVELYGKHSQPGSHRPTTQQGATEWVTQLNETATALLENYRQLHARIITLRQQYNQLMQQAQPYLN